MVGPQRLLFVRAQNGSCVARENASPLDLTGSAIEKPWIGVCTAMILITTGEMGIGAAAPYA
jgi:hypothetical protein